MANCRGDNKVIVLEIVLIFSEATQGLGNVIRNGGFLRNDQSFRVINA